jgi:peroxiredoxin Q/BCP
VCSLRDAADSIRETGGAVYGVSADDVSSLAKFHEEQGLTFPLLSDPDGSAASKYGAWVADKGYASRVTFFVDPEGVLRRVDRAVAPDTHGKDVVEALKALRPAR